MAKKLASLHPKIVYSELGHDIDEHSLEVQLPFLQQVFYDFKLLPIVMGDQSAENVDALADSLAKLLKDENALIIASSDLSHFHNYDKAKLLDDVVVENIAKYDYNKLAKDLKNGHCEMCGGGPVIATMKACEKLGANKSKVLLYRNSGDVSGDRDQVVGYLSAMFYT
jgi:AmmeMemoRadiSam system protein B